MASAPQSDHPHAAKEGFWQKFAGGQPSFAGKRVLEIGCGLGRRSIEIAQAGGNSTGIDISEGCIVHAQSQRQALDPEVAGRLVFRQCAVEQVESAAFDIVISEDTFEHIVDVPQAIATIKEKLAIGGRAYIGFGPLYHSPYGDHGWLQNSLPFGSLPWSHLFLSRQATYKLVGKKIGQKFTDTINWPYLALNQHTSSQYIQMFNNSGLKIVSISTTKHRRAIGKVFDAMAKLPFLGKYFTDGIYCILERVSENSQDRNIRDSLAA